MPDFDAIFGPPRFETRYGLVTQREYESRRADDAIRDAARTVCANCDSEGYRPNGLVCDHVDRIETARRGAELVRLELALARRKAVDHA